MDTKDLEKLGLNKNEAIVFIALINLGESTGGELIKKTSFHRNIIYDNLDKLLDKGLVSYISKSGVRYYKISSSNAIMDFIQFQKKEIDEKQIIAKKIVQEISSEEKKEKFRSGAQLFEGILGYKTMMKDTLKENKDYVVFGCPGESVSLIGEDWWKNYELKRIEKRIKVRMIFNKDLKKYGNSILNDLTKIRYFSEEFEGLTETMVYGDKVGIIVWTEKPVVTLIENKEAAKSYLKYFNLLWKSSK